MESSKKRAYIINSIAILILYGGVLGVSSSQILGRYYEGILVFACINTIMAVSLNLTTGCLGQIALGHAGFMSVGAYGSAIFTKFWVEQLTAPPYVGYAIGLLLGGLIAAAFGLLIGLPALRLKGDYLAIITLGFGEIIRVIIENTPGLVKLTGGAQGLPGVVPKLTKLPIAAAICIFTVMILFTMMKSRHGRAILSIREDDIAAESSGIRTTYYKTLAFTAAAFFAGIAGGLYGHFTTFKATNFNFNKSIEFLIIVVLGGLGSFTGSIFSAFFLAILPEVLRSFSDHRMLVYSAALILIMIFKPSGIFGTYEISIVRSIQYWKDVFTGKRMPFASLIEKIKKTGQGTTSVWKKILKYWKEVFTGKRVPFASLTGKNKKTERAATVASERAKKDSGKERDDG